MVCFISIAAGKTAWEAAGSSSLLLLAEKHGCLPEDVLFDVDYRLNTLPSTVCRGCQQMQVQSLTAWSQIAGNLAHPVFASSHKLFRYVGRWGSQFGQLWIARPASCQPAESYQILKRLNLKQDWWQLQHGFHETTWENGRQRCLVHKMHLSSCSRFGWNGGGHEWKTGCGETWAETRYDSMALMLPAASGFPTHVFFATNQISRNHIKPNVSLQDLQDLVSCCKSGMFSKIAMKCRIRCHKKPLAFAADATHVTRIWGWSHQWF